MLALEKKYLNEIILFNAGTGCIPPGAVCYCYAKSGDHFWVSFRYPILGRHDLKIHKKVIENYGIIV